MAGDDATEQHTKQDEEHEERDHERAARRADSIPEETAAGADDPERQAAAVLADSDERVEDPSGTQEESTQTPGP